MYIAKGGFLGQVNASCGMHFVRKLIWLNWIHITAGLSGRKSATQKKCNSLGKKLCWWAQSTIKAVQNSKCFRCGSGGAACMASPCHAMEQAERGPKRTKMTGGKGYKTMRSEWKTTERELERTDVDVSPSSKQTCPGTAGRWIPWMDAGCNSGCWTCSIHAVELLYVHTSSPSNVARCLCTGQLCMVCAGGSSCVQCTALLAHALSLISLDFHTHGEWHTFRHGAQGLWVT